MKIDIAGVLVDNISKQETLSKVLEFVRSGAPHYLVTTYSEFVVFAQNDPEYKKVLNEAALSLPDGIGVIWAAKYLSIPASNKLRALWQVVYTGASLIFYPAYCRSVIREQVTGSHLIWDLARIAAENNFSMSLVGGFGNVAQAAAERLKQKYPDLRISLADCPPAFDDQIVARIAASNSDILLVAYQPPKQEKWLAQNLARLNVKVAVGLGGTFDYLAGKRTPAPGLVHYLGIEWLWRLITQPWRIKRIWNAIIVFITIVYKYKVSKLHK